MSERLEKRGKIWQNLNQKYKVSIADNSSLKELSTFQYSWLRGILFCLLFFLISATITIGLLYLHPVRKLVFGNTDIANHSHFVELNAQVVDMEQLILEQNTYIDGLLGMINGDKNEVLQANPQKVALENTDKNVTQNDIPDNTLTNIRSKMLHYLSPVKGRISAGFDRSLDHLGIDIVSVKNAPIASIADGVVISSDYTIDTGNTICVQHKDNIISMYKHNSALLKKTGDYVEAGEAIAIIGNSGEQTTGPHLHFELWYDGNALDPMQFIAF